MPETTDWNSSTTIASLSFIAIIWCIIAPIFSFYIYQYSKYTKHAAIQKRHPHITLFMAVYSLLFILGYISHKNRKKAYNTYIPKHTKKNTTNKKKVFLPISLLIEIAGVWEETPIVREILICHMRPTLLLGNCLIILMRVWLIFYDVNIFKIQTLSIQFT